MADGRHIESSCLTVIAADCPISA